MPKAGVFPSELPNKFGCQFICGTLTVSCVYRGRLSVRLRICRRISTSSYILAGSAAGGPGRAWAATSVAATSHTKNEAAYRKEFIGSLLSRRPELGRQSGNLARGAGPALLVLKPQFRQAGLQKIQGLLLALVARLDVV